MKFSRILIAIFALLLALQLIPGLAGAAAPSKLATYTAPDGTWSVQYPSDLLHVEQLNEDVTIFISKDRHTVAAVDMFDATVATPNSVLLTRGATTLRQIYGKPVKDTTKLGFAGARWATGFSFNTDKGSRGEVVYHQNGKIDQDYRVFGFAYGYKSASAKAMLPVLEVMRESLQIFPPAPKGIDRARDTLRSYFGAVYAGRYNDAVGLYGGTYEILAAWNPDVKPSDHVRLFARGCEQNGLQCLRVKRIVSEQAVSATEFRFVLEFLNNDGTTFKMVQCCNNTTPKVVQAPFTVKKVGNAFLVQELPLYVA